MILVVSFIQAENHVLDRWLLGHIFKDSGSSADVLALGSVCVVTDSIKLLVGLTDFRNLLPGQEVADVLFLLACRSENCHSRYYVKDVENCVRDQRIGCHFSLLPDLDLPVIQVKGLCIEVCFRGSEITFRILTVEIPHMAVEPVIILDEASALRAYGYVFYNVLIWIQAHICHAVIDGLCLRSLSKL